jgi:hypothetical protein
VLYKGQPVVYKGEPVFEHVYSDNLLIKLLEAGDPDRFNRQKVAPFDEDFDFDKMTEGQVQGLLKWLRKRIEKAKLDRAERVPKQATEARATTAADRRTPDTPEPQNRSTRTGPNGTRGEQKFTNQFRLTIPAGRLAVPAEEQEAALRIQEAFEVAYD